MSIETILAEIDAEIKRLQQVRKLLATSTGTTPATKPATRRKRTMSAAARKRIADAQRARWVKQKRAE